MKILYYCPWKTHTFKRWVDHFSKRHEVSVLTPLAINYSMHARIHRTFRLPGQLSLYPIVGLSKWIDWFWHLWLEIRPDILHTHFASEEQQIDIRARIEFHPHIVSVWGSDVNFVWYAPSRGIPKLVVNTMRDNLFKVFNNVDLVHTECQDMAKKCINLGCPKEKILTLNWGIKIAPFDNVTKKQARERLGWDEGDKIVVSMRHLNWKYASKYQIYAARKVFKKVPNAKFYICGSGPQRDGLEKLVKDLQLREKVFLPGQIPQELVPYYLRGADCYLSTSIYDGFADSIKEAMAAELPVVSFDSGGNREFIPEGIVPLKDVDRLASKIVDFLFDEGARIGKKNRKVAEKEVNWDKNMDVMENYYKILSETYRSSLPTRKAMKSYFVNLADDIRFWLKYRRVLDPKWEYYENSESLDTVEVT